MSISFHELSDCTSYEDMKNNFQKFFDAYADSAMEKEEALEKLCELADRQWHTYNLLDIEIKDKIEKYIFSIIDLNSITIIDWILVIVPRLGLSNVFDYIIKNKSIINNNEILKLIEEAYTEYGKDVGNPYRNM